MLSSFDARIFWLYFALGTSSVLPVVSRLLFEGIEMAAVKGEEGIGAFEVVPHRCESEVTIYN